MIIIIPLSVFLMFLSQSSINIMSFTKVYPNAKIVSSAKAFAMMKGFFGTDFAKTCRLLKNINQKK